VVALAAVVFLTGAAAAALAAVAFLAGAAVVALAEVVFFAVVVAFVAGAEAFFTGEVLVDFAVEVAVLAGLFAAGMFVSSGEREPVEKPCASSTSTR
jgi:hypothetical protein